jgi:uncharacterized membrane protein
MNKYFGSRKKMVTFELRNKLMIRRALTLLFLVSNYSIASAQGGEDFIRSTGKIYAVVAVVLVLFIGIIIYLFRLERKIKNLENYNNEQ